MFAYGSEIAEVWWIGRFSRVLQRSKLLPMPASFSEEEMSLRLEDPLTLALEQELPQDLQQLMEVIRASDLPFEVIYSTVDEAVKTRAPGLGKDLLGSALLQLRVLREGFLGKQRQTDLQTDSLNPYITALPQVPGVAGRSLLALRKPCPRWLCALGIEDIQGQRCNSIKDLISSFSDYHFVWCSFPQLPCA